MLDRAWCTGHGGQGMVDRAWWTGHGGQGMVDRAWWTGHGGQGMVDRAWWTGHGQKHMATGNGNIGLHQPVVTLFYSTTSRLSYLDGGGGVALCAEC